MLHTRAGVGWVSEFVYALTRILIFMYSFEFMMPCGNKLVRPNLMAGQQMDGKTSHQIYGHKTMYFRPSVNLDTKAASDGVGSDPPFSTFQLSCSSMVRFKEAFEDVVIVDEEEQANQSSPERKRPKTGPSKSSPAFETNEPSDLYRYAAL